ncbi:MAG: BREX protein BrxB domain-containing protein [Candidatus Entotheonellia bacterium]
MSSLHERIDILEKDLLTNPLRISAYHDLPFAICHYDPRAEFEARKQIRLFATRLQNAGKRVHTISVARLLWTAIDDTEGIDAIADEAQQFGFARAQETVSTLLSDDAFRPLPNAIERRMQGMNPTIDVVFLVRVAALAPAIYRSAKLLDAMHGRTLVPIILFYPGPLDGEHSLRFMGLPEREQTGAYNYRVKIY